ncbi:Ig-like domain-containing protein [Bacteroidota bacterium]
MNIACTIFLVFACSQSLIFAQIVGPNDRVAYTADGNVNDPDDWSATPLSLAMWADVGFQNRMVHFDYHSRLFVSKANKEAENYESTIGAATRFGFDLSKFFNDQTELSASVANLTKEINASSADSRLWVCMAGPFEVLYRALLAAEEDKRQYCMMVTHSWVNEEPDKWDGCHGRTDCEALGAIYHPVRTGNGCTNAFGASGCSTWEQVDWLKDSPDEDFQWLYSRLRATWEDGNKLDASDCTMVYYLAYSDEDGNFAKLHYELGNCMYKCGANPPDPPDPPGPQPYVTITSPENGAKIATTKNVTVTVNSWDDSGINSISLFLKDLRQDSKYVSQGTQTQNYVWNVGKLTYGTWVIRAAANTKDGDKLITEFAIDVLDNPPPSVSIQSPADGAKIPSGQDVIVTVDASHDSSGINSVNLFLDGAEQGILNEEPYTWNLGNLSDGMHELKAEAISNDEQSATNTINIQYGTLTSYTLTITNGKGSGEYYGGENISVEANASPTGQAFNKWIGDIDALGNVNDSITTFSMPPANSSLTATYKNIEVSGYGIIYDNDGGPIDRTDLRMDAPNTRGGDGTWTWVKGTDDNDFHLFIYFPQIALNSPGEKLTLTMLMGTGDVLDATNSTGNAIRLGLFNNNGIQVEDNSGLTNAGFSDYTGYYGAFGVQSSNAPGIFKRNTGQNSLLLEDVGTPLGSGIQNQNMIVGEIVTIELIIKKTEEGNLITFTNNGTGSFNFSQSDNSSAETTFNILTLGVDDTPNLINFIFFDYITVKYETDINTSFHNLSSLSTTVNVYPNPANNIIHIQGADLTSNYEIYNVLGTKLQGGILGKTIDISDLNPGIYLLFVNNKASRFVKE